MDHQAIIERCLQWPGVALKHPFDPHLPVLFVGSKMFALLGRTGESESVNLKADPEEAWLLRQQYPNAVLPGYHMNKKHWNTVVLDGTVPDREIAAMLEQSYRLAAARLTRSEKEGLSLT
nr:MmcQ/YjbR family DNA-binding protein [Cohnella sp. YIM B05605]